MIQSTDKTHLKQIPTYCFYDYKRLKPQSIALNV